MSDGRQRLVRRVRDLERKVARESGDLIERKARRDLHLGWMENLHKETLSDLAKARGELKAWDSSHPEGASAP